MTKILFHSMFVFVFVLGGCIQLSNKEASSGSGNSKSDNNVQVKRGMIFSTIKYKSLDLRKIFDIYPEASRIQISVKGSGSVSFDVTDLNGSTQFSYYDAKVYYVTVVDEDGAHNMEISL